MGSTQNDLLPEIRIGKIGVLKIHQISDEELNYLEQGENKSLLLNFGISLISFAISFFIALKTTDIKPDQLYYTFVILTVLFFIGGIISLIIWWCIRKPIRKLAKEIRDRMPPEGDQEKIPQQS